MNGLSVSVDVVIERALDDPSLLLSDELVQLTEAVLTAEGATGEWEIAFALVDDSHLQELHRDFMDIDEPTDVMTFALHDGEPDFGKEHPAFGGDIVISVDRAQEQAGESSNSTAREVVFLAVHGLLHMTGWTDETPELRQRMLQRGSQLLEAFESKHLPSWS